MKRFAILMLILAFSVPSNAAVPLLSPEQLKQRSTHIVVGTVRRIYSSTPPIKKKQRTVRLVAEIEIESIEKGEGLATGQLVFARYWRAEWHGDPKKAPMDATTDIDPRPKTGARVRAYLGLNHEQGLGPDKGFNVLFPNGFDLEPK